MFSFISVCLFWEYVFLPSIAPVTASKSQIDVRNHEGNVHKSGEWKILFFPTRDPHGWVRHVVDITMQKIAEYRNMTH